MIIVKIYILDLSFQLLYEKSKEYSDIPDVIGAGPSLFKGNTVKKETGSGSDSDSNPTPSTSTPSTPKKTPKKRKAEDDDEVKVTPKREKVSL